MIFEVLTLSVDQADRCFRPVDGEVDATVDNVVNTTIGSATLQTLLRRRLHRLLPKRGREGRGLVKGTSRIAWGMKSLGA